MKTSGFIEYKERNVTVEYEYYYRPEVRYLPNGDPGYPPESEFAILGIYKDGIDIQDVFTDEEIIEMQEYLESKM